jgi:hypothetical protein
MNIRGDVANDRATLTVVVPATAATGWHFTFTYRII